MTQSKKLALMTLLIWGIVWIAFTLVFFSGGGPAQYKVEKWRRSSSAGMIAIGWTAHFFVRARMKPKKGSPHPVRDERDDAIERKANGIAFAALDIYVYTLCIILFEVYQKTGQVPVGWMWFLGYSAVFVSYISASLTALILDARMARYGQG